MSNNWYQIIDFPANVGNNGVLAMFQGIDAGGDKIKLPFEISRVLVMKGMKSSDIRGSHTHHRAKQVLVALEGGCVVELDNGKEKANVKLESFNRGLLLEPYVWHTMKNFLSNTVLLVLANTGYDEKDYIRNYDEFLKFVK